MITPHNLDAEESVLSAMMMTGRAVEAVLSELEPEGEQAFYRESHASVYRACRALHRAKKPVDSITVAALLESKGLLSDIGGRERIHEIASMTPAAGNAAHYARIVREMWAKRLALAVAVVGTENAQNGVTSTDAIEGMLTGLLDAQARIGRGRKHASTLVELGQRLEDRVRNPPTDDGIVSPFPSFPNLQPQRLYVLAGYTADGKSAAAVQFAASAAKGKAHVGFMTVEMSEDQLYDRMVAGYGVPLRQVETGRITPPNLPAYRAALTDLSAMRVSVIDDPGGNAATLGMLQRVNRYDLLIVDHLHQITLSGKPDHRRLALEDEVQGFVNLARRENVPVLLLAQLSRPHGDDFPAPTMNMLRETSRIEQQAALVAFVYRTRVEKLPTNDATLIIAKNRFGALGKFPLRFQPEQMRYVEIEEDYRG